MIEIVALSLFLSQPNGNMKRSSFIPTPRALSNSKLRLVNVKNTRQSSFKWAVLAALHPPRDHPNRVTKYLAFETSISWAGISFPTPIHQISMFEINNNLSVNVYTYEEGTIVPIRITAKKGASHHIDLLLLTDCGNQHYVIIKGMSPLIFRRTIPRHKRYLCRYCLELQYTLLEHLSTCMTITD